MTRVSIFFLIMLLFTGCGGSSTSPKSIAPSTLISQLPTPFREHGYSNFNSKIITSQAGLNTFVAQVEQQEGWNQKDIFLQALQAGQIDFTQFNLLLYRLTEPSGSINLTVQTPMYNGDIIYIQIDKTVPQTGTGDMAYYALVYLVNKSIGQIHFDYDGQEVIIENQRGDNIVPLNCLSWNDGCNSCQRDDEGNIACTAMYCEVYNPFICSEWR